MRFGIFQSVQWPDGSDQHARYRQALEQAIVAEELGFDSVWMTEHHFTRHGITSDTSALLAYLAARTDRIRLGTAVAVLPFHDPVRLAESLALVDQLSDGRLDVGIGRGYQWAEYHGFAIGLDEGSDRFEEALEVLLRSWSAEEAFAFAGRFHSYDAAFPQPKPFQRPHPPIYHATASPAGLRRCAENGWGVLLAQGTAPSAIRATVDLYRRQFDGLDAAPRTEQLVVARGMHCAPTTQGALDAFLGAYGEFLDGAARVSAPPSAAQGAAHRNPFDLGEEGLRASLVCGDPDECARSIDEVAAMGIEQVILFVNVGGVSHEDIVDSLRLFAKEVIPRYTRC